MKQILGVHGKTPNLAIHAELGLEPLCFKAFKLMFKYYNHLIEQSKDYVHDLLRSAFEEDKQLLSVRLYRS
jgi:hypothetical protein